jgi:UDP-GlcNAc3NAcA epimerase
LTHILTVIGARPQFIKAAAVSRQVARTSGLRETLIHTGQHYDANMSDVFFDELEMIKPTHHLGIGGGSHGAMTGQMLEAIENLLHIERPDVLMVYGDTNSTLAGALAASKVGIPVAHVEAGLRSFNKHMPEEINRILTDHCAEFLFTPTTTATRNLLREGLGVSRIVESGDVMYDAAVMFGQLAKTKGAGANRLGLPSSGYVLATIHRQENTDNPARLAAIFKGLEKVAIEWPVILPIHPRTRKKLETAGLSSALSKLITIDPVGYLDMVGLERGADIIVTDSGGVQKEAFFHKVPCVTLRDETEWVELVEAGWNRLVPPDSDTCIAEAILAAFETSGSNIEPYGDGNAAEKIAAALKVIS